MSYWKLSFALTSQISFWLWLFQLLSSCKAAWIRIQYIRKQRKVMTKKTLINKNTPLPHKFVNVYIACSMKSIKIELHVQRSLWPLCTCLICYVINHYCNYQLLFNGYKPKWTCLMYTCQHLVNVDFNQSINQSLNLYIMPKDFFNQLYQDFQNDIIFIVSTLPHWIVS